MSAAVLVETTAFIQQTVASVQDLTPRDRSRSIRVPDYTKGESNG